MRFTSGFYVNGMCLRVCAHVLACVAVWHAYALYLSPSRSDYLPWDVNWCGGRVIKKIAAMRQSLLEETVGKEGAIGGDSTRYGTRAVVMGGEKGRL